MKRMILLTLALMLALAAGAAMAEGMPPEVPRKPGLPQGNCDIVLRPRLRGKAAFDCALVTDEAASLGQAGRWHAEGPEDSQYWFMLYETEANNATLVYDSSTYDNDTDATTLYSAEAAFAYTLREPGDYLLRCRVKNAEGKVAVLDEFFQVAAEPGADTVSARVAMIAEECRAAGVTGSYDIALWLHDWIINHCYYDYYHHYHGADSILFYGTGVCDSYAKLYVLLLNEFGIQAERVTGYVYGTAGHAWNRVCLDGTWCQVDPTWDDPESGSNPDAAVSGYENHDYFGVTDAIMRLDHSFSFSEICASYDCCYVLRQGEHRQWLRHVWPLFDQGFAQGRVSFDVDTQGRVVYKWLDNGTYIPYDAVMYPDAHGEMVRWKTAYAALLMGQERWSYLGAPASAAFSYDETAHAMRCEALLDAQSAGAVRPAFALPEALGSLDADAFANASALVSLRIPAGVKTIGPGAFSGCASLRFVAFEGDDVDIDADAFEGVPEGCVFFCGRDSGADRFAQARGGLTLVYR